MQEIRYSLDDLLQNNALREAMVLELATLIEPDAPDKQPDLPTYIYVRDNLGLKKEIALTRDVLLSDGDEQLIKYGLEAAALKRYEKIKADPDQPDKELKVVQDELVHAWETIAQQARERLAAERMANRNTVAEFHARDGVLKKSLSGLWKAQRELHAEHGLKLDSEEARDLLLDKYKIVYREQPETPQR